MEFIDFLRQMDRMCECTDHCQNCPLKPFPCNDDIASIARNVDDQTLPQAARLPSMKMGARCGMLFAARFTTAASADCWRSWALSWTENSRTAR